MTAGPDLAIVDVRMPPTCTDEGIWAAALLRSQNPSLRFWCSRTVDASSAAAAAVITARSENGDVIIIRYPRPLNWKYMSLL